MFSIILGAGWISLDARYSISIEFILLGISFDALRLFYVRTLSLLAPQTAVGWLYANAAAMRIGAGCSNVSFTCLSSLEAQPTMRPSRAPSFLQNPISHGPCGAGSQELDEFAHKAIARDTHGANEIIGAMAIIGQQYTDSRRSSLILTPDWDHLFAGGVSDISEVLNPILESIRAVCQDASTAPNETVGAPSSNA